jgi:spore maturation protein CgeB
VKSLCVFGRHNYGAPERGQGYEYVNFIPALQALGCQVEFFDSLDRTHHQDFGELNGALLQTVRRIDPDIIFFVLMHFEIWTETLDFLRSRTRAVLINWATDDSWKYRPFSRHLAPHFDIHATTSGAAAQAARRDGLDNFVLTQWAASGSALREPLAADRCRYPVAFVGSNYGNRAAWVNSLRQRGIEVACFGHGWPGGAVAAERIPEIIRESVISLNFGDSGVVWSGWLPGRSRQIKARVFEVPGSGGFLMTEPADDLDRYFSIGREIETFASQDELADKIRHYLAHPAERDAIALAGHRRVREEHTYETRFRRLLDEAETRRRRRPGPAVSGGATPDWAEFEDIARAHRMTPALELLRKALLLICVPLWGRRRGPRAARRLVFELSWRLAGARTYSARGWPGRLFFQES